MEPNTGEKLLEYECPHNCQPTSCANGQICGTVNLPEWVTNFKHGCCISCARQFGKVLAFVGTQECPICMDAGECVKQLNCDHYICISCFKRCYYGEDPPQPPFPYPEQEDEYYDGDSDDPKWKNDPVIQKWWEDCDMWDDKRCRKYRSEENLRHCPLCRK